MKINFRQMLIGLILWPLPLGLVSAQDQKIVDIEMVLAVDISSSVDAGEFQLQMNGLAEAFRNPEIIAAIAGLDSGGIA